MSQRLEANSDTKSNSLHIDIHRKSKKQKLPDQFSVFTDQQSKYVLIFSGRVCVLVCATLNKGLCSKRACWSTYTQCTYHETGNETAPILVVL